MGPSSTLPSDLQNYMLYWYPRWGLKTDFCGGVLTTVAMLVSGTDPWTSWLWGCSLGDGCGPTGEQEASCSVGYEAQWVWCFCSPLDGRAGFPHDCLHGSGGLLAGDNMLQCGSKLNNLKYKAKTNSHKLPKLPWNKTGSMNTPILKKFNLLFKTFPKRKL